MTKIIEKLRKLKLGESLVIAMANLRSTETGLPMIVWIQPKTGREKHGPRIKVQKDHGDKVNIDNWVSVTISDTPKVLGELAKADQKLVINFILKNKEILLDYWNDEISLTEILKKIKKSK